jgi:serine/threonine-protein kinase
MNNPKKGTILCVDDEPHVLRALQWLLQKEFEVHTASSAGDGLKLLALHDFDVVVSDQRMPGVTGVEFLLEVRKAAPRAMRILLTGYSDLESMVRSVNESEVYRFVTKPWDIRELPRLIAEAAQIARLAPAMAIDAPADAVAPALSPLGVPTGATEALAGRHTRVLMRPDESVLLIEDDERIRDTVQEVLGPAVCVRYAANLAEAVASLAENPASIVISDVRVGKVDVTRLIRLLKAKHPEVVTVVFSGVQDAKVVMDLINQGQVYRFIPKPFKAGFIRLVIDSAIRRHRQLTEMPEARKRFGVEAAGEEAEKSLERDVAQSARGMRLAPAAAGAPGAAFGPGAGSEEQGFMQRISGGFRRLFGS